ALSIVKRDAGYERGLKPTEMLSARVQLHVGRVAPLTMPSANRAMREPAVNTNVVRVVAFSCSSGKSQLLCKVNIVQFEPDVRATLRNEIGKLANYFRIKNRFALSRVKDR